MKFAGDVRLFGTRLDEVPGRLARKVPGLRKRRSTFLVVVGWVSAGAGALGLGVIVGRELRQRYKFNRRTPYDLYSHAGGSLQNDVEFGVGI